MKTEIIPYPKGFIVLATIPQSAKNNTRRSQKTWRVKCLRPEVVVVELKNHLRAQVDKWAQAKQSYFEKVSGKPSTVLGVSNEHPEITSNESVTEQSLPNL